MKIEPFILKTSILGIFKWCSCQGSQSDKRSYMFLLKEQLNLSYHWIFPELGGEKKKTELDWMLSEVSHNVTINIWQFHYSSNKVNWLKPSLSQTLLGQDLELLWTRRLLLYLQLCCCLVAKSGPTLVTSWTVAKYQSMLPFLPPGYLPDAGMEPLSPASQLLMQLLRNCCLEVLRSY